MGQALQNVVGRNNLELVHVDGDGNCQFHAVCHQLTSRFSDECPPAVFTHEFVRKLAVVGVKLQMTPEERQIVL
jgi:hypothetical protein